MFGLKPQPGAPVRSIMDEETAKAMARYLLRDLECVELAVEFLNNVERDLE